MQLCIRRLACLAILVGILAMASPIPVKVTECCTKVSTAMITAPIIDFKYQRKNLPCVTAIIFRTTEGDVCVHPKLNWVFPKVQEIRANKTAAALTTANP